MIDLRLEPIPSGGINESLAARIHDPLWFLARQWQLGEFQGDDTGSPARLKVLGTSAAVGAYALGNGPWQPFDLRDSPLDPVVESSNEGADVRLRIEAGGHFLRLLTSRALQQHRDAVVTACAFEHPKEFSSDALLAMCAARFPDADLLATELSAFIDGRQSRVSIAAADQSAFVEVAREWLAWYDSERGSRPAGVGDAWDPHRLEHRLRIASAAAGGVVLRAGDYAGETLGWPEFDVDHTAEMPSFSLPVPQPLDLSATPTPVRFGGMPSPRYWEFEDARFNFGNVDAAGHDLGRLLLLQFATLYGNDWFLVPVPLEVGTMTLLDHAIVTDVFGRHFGMTRAGADEPQWNLFSHQASSASEGSDNPSGEEPTERHSAMDALFLPPTLGLTLESDSLELVHLMRDEMANLAWGIERYCESPLGGRVDRHAAWLANRKASSLDLNNQMPHYIVATEVPTYWIPLVPQKLADRRSIRLIVTPLAVPSGETFKPAKPEGRFLKLPDGKPLWFFEEEIPRSGVTVDRVWKYGRWHDGRAFLWRARRKRTGQGEGSSGLRFDAILPE